MAIECSGVIKQCLETLAEGFHCQYFGDILIVTTPYLYHDDDMIYVSIEELPEGRIRVADQGEAAMHPFSHGFDLTASPWGRELAQEVAWSEGVDYVSGTLAKTGPASELGSLMLDVVMAARGVSDLIYAHRAYLQAKRSRPDFPHTGHSNEIKSSIRVSTAYDAFPGKLKAFLVESKIDLVASPVLAGSSGQSYTVDYQVNKVGYLRYRNPMRPAGAKPMVDRTYRMWADCAGSLDKSQMITLLNDENFRWRESHVNLLGSVSTVLSWSERDRLPELVGSLN